MKKTQLLLLFQNIRVTLVSFLSILLFVGLGIGIFLGIKWNQPALSNAADQYYQQHNFQDFAVSYPYGVSAGDISAIEALPAVTLTEGGYTAEGTVLVNEDRYVLAIQSLTQKLNTAVALTGELPAAENEVGIEQKFAEATGLGIGDTLSITSKDGDDNCLLETDFRITSIVEHPAYMSLETEYARGCSGIGDGAVDYYVLMSPNAFNLKTYDNCFSNVYIRCDSFRSLNSYTDEYRALADGVADELKALGKARGPIRYQEMMDRFNKEIKDAETQIANGDKQITDAEKQIADAEKDIEKADKDIVDADKEMAEADKDIADADKEMADVDKEIKDGEKELKAAQKEYQDGEDEYGAAANELTNLLKQLQQELQAAGFSTEASRAKAEMKALLGDLEDAKQLIALLTAIDDYNNIPDSDPAKGAALDALQTALRAAGLTGDPTADEAEIYAILTALQIDPATTDIDQEILDIQEFIAVIDEYLAGVAGLSSARSELNAAALEIRKGEKELADAKVKFAKAEKELADAKVELADAKKELADAKVELAKAKVELEDAKVELEKGKKELEDGKTELAKAKKELGKLFAYDQWTVEKRADNASYDMAKVYGESSKKLCYSMALLFVFVGLMVCYTAISRIVREQQVFTGVQKALGFTQREIVRQYMAYSILAVFLGSVLGGALGYFGVEAVMNDSFSSSFVFGAFPNYFCWTDLLIIVGVELALILFATWLACHKLLKRQAVELLRGGDPAAAKTHRFEKRRWWNRCSLYTQTTINNLLGDGPRVIATLVGVAGCTALVVMAMSLQLAILNTPERHFSDVFTYDERLVADDSGPAAMEQLAAVLKAENVDYTTARQKAIFIEKSNGDLYKADIIVPSDAKALDGFIRLVDPDTGETLALPEKGILISETYAEYHHVGVGDAIQLMDMDGKRHSCVIAGVTTHYLSTYQIVMCPAYYEAVMGKAPVDNTFYINLNGADAEALGEKLTKVPGRFSYTDEYAKWSELFAVLLESTSLAVYIALFLAAVMAMLVLLNLNVTFINEKAKELIVMRINGFSVGEAKKYIYRDNIVLTLIGIIIGVGVGLALGLYVILSIQSEGDNILKEPSLIACAVGVATGALFALITNLIALRRVGKLRVSDLNKL